MRLLHIGTFQLQEFQSNPPPYAIASHRWLDEEVTYQEVSKGLGRDKKGWRKVLGFCNAIKRVVELSPAINGYPLHWIWIDTCCIDKTNSVELQEALNSMFKWYAEADFCLALLHDVHSLGSSCHGVQSEMTQSVWWTRGWTLQELLAPKLIVFYNCDWDVLGHKTTMSPILPFSARAVTVNFMNPWIANITGIDEYVLLDYSNAEKLSIEEKLSWMTNRQTTRIEDRVYCQLGIFGVFMPLIYGEGEHAMVRLEEAIEQKQRRKQHRIVVHHARRGHLDRKSPNNLQAKTEILMRADETVQKLEQKLRAQFTGVYADLSTAPWRLVTLVGRSVERSTLIGDLECDELRLQMPSQSSVSG